MGDVKRQEVMVRFADRPLFFKFVLIPGTNLGGTRSVPAEIGTTVPDIPIRSINPREHPQEMRITAGIRLKPLEPENNSTLVQEYPPELMSEDPAD